MSVKDVYVDAGMTDDSLDGLSWATAKRTIHAAVDLLDTPGHNNIYIAGGDYFVTTARIACDVAGSSDTVRTIIHGSYKNGRTRIHRASTTVDSVSCERNYLTVNGIDFYCSDASTQSDIYIGNTGAIVEDCNFYSPYRAINQNTVSGKIVRCGFYGRRLGSTENVISFGNASSGDMEHCHFHVDSFGRGCGAINGALSSGTTWNFSHCYFSGFNSRFLNVISGNGSYVFRNCQVLGNNSDYSTAALAIIHLTSPTATVDIDYCTVLPSVLYPANAYLRSGAAGIFTLGSHNVYANPQITDIGQHGYVVPIVDDNPDYAKLIYDTYFKPLGQKICVAAVAYKNAYAEELTSFNQEELQEFVNEGNDVACHSYSHPRLTNLHAIVVSGPVGSSVTVASDQTSFSSNEWTGTISFSDGASTILQANLQDYEELGALCTYCHDILHAINSAWSVAYNSSNSMSPRAKSVCIASQTISNPSSSYVDMDADAFYHVELVEAKEIIESYIRSGASTGSRAATYTIKLFCMTFNTLDDTVRQRILDAGFSAIRGDTRRLPSSIFGFKPYRMGYIYSDDFLFDSATGNETLFRRNAASFIAGYIANGWFGTVELHDPSKSTSLTDTEVGWLASELAKSNAASVSVNTVLELDYTSSGSGIDSTLSLAVENSYDGSLVPASPCIGTGVAISGLTADADGNPTPGPCGTSIGPCEYMSDTPEGYGTRALFDGTVPAWE